MAHLDEYNSKVSSFKSNENIHKKEDGSYYVVSANKLLSDRQHAFRKRHSCETQLTTVINDWAKILDDEGQADTFI